MVSIRLPNAADWAWKPARRPGKNGAVRFRARPGIGRRPEMPFLMSLAERPTRLLHLDLPDEAATETLAAALAAAARPGDVLALEGDLGAGKTVFARAFIRACGNGLEEVPSPTFTLVQTYELPGATIYHFDLFRLTDPEEAYELAIEEAFADGISLIEWPDRLGPLLPPGRLEIALDAGSEPTARRVTLTGAADWGQRLKEAGLA
jgi:tRNA threonylcarbamoyladenosine biosynthesis protein TsaE